MRFALWINAENSWPEVAETATQADESGWDAVYIADHFMPVREPAVGPRLEAWTTLGAIAALTDRARIGVLVTGNTYRHPAVLANMAATTDRISNGRLVLGLGAGWQVNEHEAYGIELFEVPERIARLDEACQVIQLLFSQDRANFEGHYYRLSEAPCEPKPVQSPLPLLVGASGERHSMRVAAQRAQIWNCWGTPAYMKRKMEVFDSLCEEVGREPGAVERSTQALVYSSKDDAELDKWRDRVRSVGPDEEDRVLIGTPSELSSQLAAYEEIGIDEFVLSDRTLGDGLSARLEGMRGFLEEIAAPFRRP